MDYQKPIMGLKTIVSQKISSLRLLSLFLFYMDVRFGIVLSLESYGGRYDKSKNNL